MNLSQKRWCNKSWRGHAGHNSVEGAKEKHTAVTVGLLAGPLGGKGKRTHVFLKFSQRLTYIFLCLLRLLLSPLLSPNPLDYPLLPYKIFESFSNIIAHVAALAINHWMETKRMGPAGRVHAAVPRAVWRAAEFTQGFATHMKFYRLKPAIINLTWLMVAQLP